MSRPPVWTGYADAKPSESIQPHAIPGIAVAVVFPYCRGNKEITPPLRQYKDYSQRQKATKARHLIDWLEEQRKEGLRLAGFSNTHTQQKAALMGLDLLQELPDSNVVPDYDSFRLNFGSHTIDLAQAVALQYYLFTIEIGILRAGTLLPQTQRHLRVLMDRFPATRPSDPTPGQPLPATPGQRLLQFTKSRASTWREIAKENQSIGLCSEFASLDWWQPDEGAAPRKGGTHPLFALPDWLCAAALADEFPDEYALSFNRHQVGLKATEALSELFAAFKEFDIWSMTKAVDHIVASETHWTVPDDVRDFIFDRAASDSAETTTD